MMRRKSAAALIAVASLLLAGCAGKPPTTAPDPRLEGTWHLVLETEDGGTVASGAEEITLTINNTAHSGGATPCSKYRASVRGGIGAVFINAGLPNSGTRCVDPQLQHIDDQYLSALSSTTIANLDDGVLVLNSPHSSLVYIKPTASSLGTLQNTNWTLVEPPNLSTPTSVHLTFGRVNQFTITTNCSESIAHYLLIEDIIIVKTVQTSIGRGRTCSSTDRAAQDVVDGQLTADVSAATSQGPATLVLTNRSNEQPLLWRAS